MDCGNVPPPHTPIRSYVGKLTLQYWTTCLVVWLHVILLMCLFAHKMIITSRPLIRAILYVTGKHVYFVMIYSNDVTAISQEATA